MKIGLFGGTFDPVHRGHIAVARAAMDRYKLGRIYFVVANFPPHKQNQPHTPFAHRYTMVALATAGEKAFLPSLLEAPEELRTGESRSRKPNYSIETVRLLKQSLSKSDHLFFLIGMDAFAEIAKWHRAEALLRECDFIVAGRPGYSLADVANALPKGLRPTAEITPPFQKQAARGDLVLPGATLHLLGDLRQSASATAIRQAINAGKSLDRFLHPSVANYIKKMGLYKNT